MKKYAKHSPNWFRGTEIAYARYVLKSEISDWPGHFNKFKKHTS